MRFSKKKTQNRCITVKKQMYNIIVPKNISACVLVLFIQNFKHYKEAKMQITDIKVRKVFDDGPMKAVVSITLDGQLAVHDVKVINARDKLFIVMPSRQNPDGTYRDIVHPINAEFRSTLEREVIVAYKSELEALERSAALTETI